MYFPDKVNPRSKSASGNKVPKLDFYFNKEMEKEKEKVGYLILNDFFIIKAATIKK